jgi:hypothetical protein
MYPRSWEIPILVPKYGRPWPPAAIILSTFTMSFSLKMIKKICSGQFKPCHSFPMINWHHADPFLGSEVLQIWYLGSKSTPIRTKSCDEGNFMGKLPFGEVNSRYLIFWCSKVMLDDGVRHKSFLLCSYPSFKHPYASVARLLRPGDLCEGIQVRVKTRFRWFYHLLFT